MGRESAERNFTEPTRNSFVPGGTAGRTLSATHCLREDAEATAKWSIQQMSSGSNMCQITLVSELRDTEDVESFEFEDVFRVMASDAGLELAVRISPDRRGYLHQLVLRRVEAQGADETFFRGRISWVDDRLPS